jgi:hypothetical protein
MNQELNEKTNRRRPGKWMIFLFVLACSAALLAVLYLEEDIRGKHAWDSYQTKLQSQGEELSWNSYVPTAVPDALNVWKAPNMEEWFIRKEGINNQPLFSKELISDTVSVLANEADASHYLVACDAVKSDLQGLRDALQRPYVYIGNAHTNSHVLRVHNFVSIRTVAQVLSQITHCHLLLKEPQQAREALFFLHDFRRILEGEPGNRSESLIVLMINTAIVGMESELIGEGIKRGVWSAEDLNAIQRRLSEIDLLKQLDHAFKVERAAIVHRVDMTRSRDLATLFLEIDPQSNQPTKRGWEYWKVRLMPQGWILQNLKVHVALMTETYGSICDPKNQTLVPHKIQEGQVHVQRELSSFSPFHVISRVTIPNYVRACQVLAQRQTVVNQLRIACLLESYRLNRQDYPETLDGLELAPGSTLPHDIVGGKSLKYRRESSTSYLLYSIGWNETDDGGKVTPDKTGRSYDEHGDWIWRPN